MGSATQQDATSGARYAADMVRGAAILMVTWLASSARAGGVTVDWAQGVVTAEGVGVADRHAPNPAVARGTSRRGAEDAARAAISAKLGELPLASGGTVAAKANDPAVNARLARAVAGAVAIAAEPETDGAWRVTMAVPIEAVREAIDGPRALGPTGDAGPAVVVVEGASAKPAVGWTVAGKHAATLWLGAVPAWATDAPRVKATKAANGAIEVGSEAGTSSEATLFVILGKP